MAQIVYLCVRMSYWPISLSFFIISQELNKYKDLWDVMDEMDKNCWILEPESRLRSCCYRRIAIGKILLYFLKLKN